MSKSLRYDQKVPKMAIGTNRHGYDRMTCFIQQVLRAPGIYINRISERCQQLTLHDLAHFIPLAGAEMMQEWASATAWARLQTLTSPQHALIHLHRLIVKALTTITYEGSTLQFTIDHLPNFPDIHQVMRKMWRGDADSMNTLHRVLTFFRDWLLTTQSVQPTGAQIAEEVHAALIEMLRQRAGKCLWGYIYNTAIIWPGAACRDPAESNIRFLDQQNDQNLWEGGIPQCYHQLGLRTGPESAVVVFTLDFLDHPPFAWAQSVSYTHLTLPTTPYV